MKKLSIIVPCFNEEESIPYFYDEVKKVTKNMDIKLELIFVDDGSRDKTLEVIKSKTDDKEVKYISFSRNFGKEAAMYAGLSMASGDYVTIMDVDLQDPPSLLPEMVRLIEEEGYDCVATKSTSRNGYSFLRKTFTKWFYDIIGKMSKTEMVPGARDYRLMTRQMVEAVLSMKEYNRYSKGLFSFVGFKTKWIEFENKERVAGTTKWNFWKLFSYALDGIVGFSTAPLTMAAFIGVLFCLIAFIMIIVIIVKTLAFGDPTSGWPSLACIIFMVSGIQLLCLGVIGEYLAKMYLEVKQRPIYIIKESNVDKK
ncbi:MAG: glycosyltransferase family 2 protein [Bacilli bacterium]|nr:glycosyltransferase family 2 protein [Bacilli bacterium]MDY5996602.1 glycosyltransferase family 2 protein [Bacilli bacterium]MEE1370772.1 glycosyltransferase family 2 protein [Bacilli bacterium]